MRWRDIGFGAAATAAGLAGYSHWQARRAEAAVPMDGTTIDVKGARLHYVDRGHGPAIVMVHGLGGQLRNFSYALAERLADDYRLILVDRPGSGYSAATGAVRPGVAEQGAIVGRLIDALGLDRPLLLGHSLGGAVGLALALDRPGLLRGLALVAPLTQSETTEPAAFRALARPSAVGRTLVAHLVGVPLGQLTQAQVRARVFSPEPVPADFGVAGGVRLALRPGNLDASMLDLVAAHGEMAGLAARYPGLDLPVSILYGRGDAILNPERHGRLTAEQIAGATFEPVDGGHMLPVTRPDLTAAFVRAADQRSSTSRP